MKQDLPKGHTGIQAKRHFDGDRMVIETAPNKRYVFLDRRIGITWPSQYSPGYYAIYGLLDERETPVVMLSERKTDDTIAKMVAGLYAAAMAYRCSLIYADMSDEYGLPYKEVALYSRKLRHDAPRIIDSSDWGSIARGIPIMEQLNNREALVIPAGTVIISEYESLRPDAVLVNDRVQPHQRFPAVNALAQCVCGWEIFPYRKRRHRESIWASGEGY